MNFFKSQLCKNGSCCNICRNEIGGLDFRIAIKDMFEDVFTVDFECPSGIVNAITHYKTADVKEKKKTKFDNIYEDIFNNHKDPWLLSMANKCKEMYDNPPKSITCKDKRAFKARWYEKLKYYKMNSNLSG